MSDLFRADIPIVEHNDDFVRHASWLHRRMADDLTRGAVIQVALIGVGDSLGRRQRSRHTVATTAWTVDGASSRPGAAALSR